MSQMTRFLLVLMLCGLCSAYPGIFQSPKIVNKIAKLLTEDCFSSDVESSEGFTEFLQRVDEKLRNMMMEMMNKTYSNFSNSSTMRFPQEVTPFTMDNQTMGKMNKTYGNFSDSSYMPFMQMDAARGCPRVNVPVFLMLYHYTMKDDEYGQKLMGCVEKSCSSEMAWSLVLTNLTSLHPPVLKLLLWGSENHLLRAKADTIRKLPNARDSKQLQLMMRFFCERYHQLSKEMRMEIFLWARRSMLSSHCSDGKMPPRTNQSIPALNSSRDPSRDDCGPRWINNKRLAVLGIFIIHAPDEDFKQIRPEQLCDLYNNGNFSRWLSQKDNLDPRRAKHLLVKLKIYCTDRAQLWNVSRLGGLACFYDNAESVDKEKAEALLSYMKSCRNKGAKENFTILLRHLAQKQVLRKEFLSEIGPFASALSSRQLTKISDSDISDVIGDLGQGRGWSKRQCAILVKKFLRHKGQVISGLDLVRLGSLVKGVNSKVLSNVSGDQLLWAAKKGLEEEAGAMSDFQRRVIVQTILVKVNSTACIKSLSGPLLKELPLSAIQHADVRNLGNLTDKPWNKAQALHLCQVLLSNGSMSASKFSQLGALIQGVTCQMLDAYSARFGMQLGQALGNVTLLSRKQLMCAAQNFRDAVKQLGPNANREMVMNFSESIPSSVVPFLGEETISRLYKNNCKTFLKKMAEAQLDLLPRSSPARELLRERALRCLNTPVSALNASEVDQLGMMVCELTGQNISDLSDQAFNASMKYLCKCQQFHPSASLSLDRCLRRTLGPPSGWTGDTVASLGTMVALLQEDTIQQLPNSTDIKEALKKFLASQSRHRSIPLPEFQTGFDLAGIQKKFFQIIYQKSQVETGSRTALKARSCSSALSSEQILELGQANTEWSPEQLDCMSVQTFNETVYVLAAVDGFSKEQTLTLKGKAIELWGPMSSISPENIENMQCIMVSASPSELRAMNISSIDTLDRMSACSTWSQEQRTALLDRYLEMNKMDVESLGSIQLIGLGGFICAMNGSCISQLQKNAVRLATVSLGKLRCGTDTMDALKDKVVEEFGAPKMWTRAEVTDLGNIVAGISAQELKTLNPEVMGYINSEAVILIPPNRFQELSVSQLENLSPEGAAAVTDSQKALANEEQKEAVKRALGPSNFINPVAPSHSPRLGSFGPSALTRALLTLILLLAAFP
ncbi:otoancorin-like isoform X2 [Narcine bancroftii]|uniref:otoancorin-like isoform X2 n=1 Tax=Narcine bancroftii TaxID=1343680 RepID=UPI003832001B